MAIKCGIGQPVRRKEDFRLLTGQGRFSDDINLPDQAYACVARSPYAHAWIRRIDVKAALAAPGVLAVLTGADYLADGLRRLPNRPNPPDVALRNRDGSEIFLAPDYPLVTDKVRHCGEGVVLIVAETFERAEDAAELVEVEYEPLPSVTDPSAAVEPGAPRIWDQVPGNICIDAELGDKVATNEAFARAQHVTRIDVTNNRVTGVPLEPRAAIGDYDVAAERYTLYAGGQGILIQKRALCEIFGAPEDKVRVICGDVGGGFGTRNLMFREFVLAVWAAKRLGRPVKWRSGRSEAFLSDPHGRDWSTQAELALDADGRFLALRAYNVANLGSHTLHFVPLARGSRVMTAVYAIPVAHIGAKAVFTNTVPISTYRGAGRPEAMYVVERLIDAAAREMGIDRVELRRRNLIPPSALPYTNPLGTTYDSGEFEANMDGALKLAEWDRFPKRRAEARRRGLLLGIGLANYIETATGIPQERAHVEIRPDGWVDLILGTQASGQGHETSFAQVITEWLGVPFDRIRLITGDTDVVVMGSGSHSSRSMRLAALLLRQATDDVIEEGKRVAAQVLEAAPDDIRFGAGRFVVAGTSRSLGLFEVAAAAESADLPEERRGKLAASAEIRKLMPTFPNGCHVCEVEVDPETGAVSIVRYSTVDDVGRVINPLIVHGQTHGGIAQGVGQALLEHCAYGESGQLLSGSLMEYGLPRADHLPFFAVATNEVLAPNNPLGVKGGGEGGATGAPPAVINAIVDALKDVGVHHIEMPATPWRVWQAIHERDAHGG